MCFYTTVYNLKTATAANFSCILHVTPYNSSYKTWLLTSRDVNPGYQKVDKTICVVYNTHTIHIVSRTIYIVCDKKVPDIVTCNSSKTLWILIIFGRKFRTKQAVQRWHNFPPLPDYCFCTTTQNWKHRNLIFSLKYCVFLC